MKTIREFKDYASSAFGGPRDLGDNGARRIDVSEDTDA
jgi:hypothetical protein